MSLSVNERAAWLVRVNKSGGRAALPDLRMSHGPKSALGAYPIMERLPHSQIRKGRLCPALHSQFLNAT